MTNPNEIVQQAMSMRAALILMESEEQTIIKAQAAAMRIRHQAYTAARMAGFNDEQAFELAKIAI